SSLVFEVNSKQYHDPLLMKFKESILSKFKEEFTQEGDGVLRYQGILCVPDVYCLRGQIFEESDGSRYTIHSDDTKMYHNR
ncbi:MAG: hypothetical protein Q8776_02520, partial [Sweet potato little leaf phytoplasma]|nr:hypothetical protein [Sweet potato little leaf phytoplasma]